MTTNKALCYKCLYYGIPIATFEKLTKCVNSKRVLRYVCKECKGHTFFSEDGQHIEFFLTGVYK